MPSIKRNEDQARALEEITEELSQIASLQAFLSKEWSDDTSLRISAASQDSKRGIHVMAIPITDKDVKTIRRIAEARRERLAKDIQKKADAYDIELSEEDLLVLAPPAQAKAVINEPTSRNPVEQDYE